MHFPMLAPKRLWQTIGEVLENHENKHRINSDFPKKHGVKNKMTCSIVNPQNCTGQRGEVIS